MVKFRPHLSRGYAEEKITYAKPPLHDKGPYKWSKRYSTIYVVVAD